MHYKRFREIRRERNQTQAWVCRKLSISQTQYSRYERGESEIPLDFASGFAYIFNISLDYLSEITDEKKIASIEKQEEEKEDAKAFFAQLGKDLDEEEERNAQADEKEDGKADNERDAELVAVKNTEIAVLREMAAELIKRMEALENK